MDKPTKILIGMPTDGNLSTEFVDSYVGLLFYTQKKYPLVQFEHCFIKGVRTDKNRNLIVDKFLKENFDYLVFLDTDMVYPQDMLEKYIESGKDLLGCVYFKRSAPYHPVAYKFSGVPDTPFSTVDPVVLPQNMPVEVDGVGTGGMFLSREVFRKLEVAGEDPWFKYGDNYHLPFKTSDQTTHDLVFCKKCREAGIEIFIHTGVYCGHLEIKEITVSDWLPHQEAETTGKTESIKKEGFVTIILPAYGSDAKVKLYNTLESLHRETGYDNYEVIVVIDGSPELLEEIKLDRRDFPKTTFKYQEENAGFGRTVNEAIKSSDSDLFCYLAQDLIFGKNWLDQAVGTFKAAFKDGCGLVTFNDGKWMGEVACHGLVGRKFIERYCGETLFFDGYHHYNVDMELTEVAKRESKLAYAYNSMVFHEQAKIGRSEEDESYRHALTFIEQDNKLFNERKALDFPRH